MRTLMHLAGMLAVMSLKAANKPLSTTLRAKPRGRSYEAIP
jgi:hypothetical protein